MQMKTSIHYQDTEHNGLDLALGWALLKLVDIQGCSSSPALAISILENHHHKKTTEVRHMQKLKGKRNYKSIA